MRRTTRSAMRLVAILFALWAWRQPTAPGHAVEEDRLQLYLPLVGADWQRLDYRQEMRSFMQGISEYGENTRPGFLIIPQNGATALIKPTLGNGQYARAVLECMECCTMAF